MARSSVKIDGQELSTNGKGVSLSIGGALNKTYISVFKDRQWLRKMYKARIKKLKRDEKDAIAVKCDKCTKHLYQGHIEDTLLALCSDFKNVLDSLSRFDNKHDLEKLLENVVVEAARTSVDYFIKYVPEDDQERILFEYRDQLKLKTEDLIRRILQT